MTYIAPSSGLVKSIEYARCRSPLVEYALELVQIATGVPLEPVERLDASDDEALWIRVRLETGAHGDWIKYGLSPHWDGIFRLQPERGALEAGIAQRPDGRPDWLLSMVWLALRVEERNAPLDEHGRVDAKSLYMVRQGQHRVPWGHVWAKACLAEWGASPRRTVASGVEISVDIDHLLAFAGRSWSHVLLAAGRDVCLLRGHKAWKRLRAKWGGKDDYDTLEVQKSLWPGGCPWKYFALVQLERNTRDTGVDASNRRARALWRSIDQATGGQLGWHPSTRASSGLEKGFLQQEYDAINSLLGRKVEAARFHFLAFTPHRMYPVLNGMGIKNDYSMGFVDCMGWRSGMGVPYPWFDLDRGRRLDLWVHPFYAMDGHLLYYQNSSEPFKEWMDAAELCASHGVPFSWVTHWRMFSEKAPEWRGWSDFVSKLQQWERKY